MQLLSEILYNENQSWKQQTIVALDGKTMLRVKVTRNAYEFQSHVVADVAPRVAQTKWTRILERPIVQTPAHAITYVMKKERVEGPMMETVNETIALVLTMLGIEETPAPDPATEQEWEALKSALEADEEDGDGGLIDSLREMVIDAFTAEATDIVNAGAASALAYLKKEGWSPAQIRQDINLE